MSNCYSSKCPNCGRSDCIDVQAHVWVRLLSDGTDADQAQTTEHDWGEDDPARCAACDWQGVVSGMDEDPAACENCGNTANDGSDVCDQCGGAFVEQGE